MDIRKAIAGALIRLAHRIYRPRVTEFASGGPITHCRCSAESDAIPAFLRGHYGTFEDEIPPEWARHPMPPERRESRGWN